MKNAEEIYEVLISGKSCETCARGTHFSKSLLAVFVGAFLRVQDRLLIPECCI